MCACCYDLAVSILSRNLVGFLRFASAEELAGKSPQLELCRPSITSQRLDEAAGEDGFADGGVR